MSKGCIYLVGTGPGDPGLITVRGMDLLACADVVVYDYLIPQRLLENVPPGAELIYVGKRAGQHTMRQGDINKLLVEKARAGAKVVRLKGGDPFVFARGGEEALVAVEAGVDFEVVPGITAGIAGPAYAGIPVTHRTLAGNVGLVTGHETPDKANSDLDFEALAKWKGTLVFYMGVANLPTICRRLIACGLDDQTPAAVIQWATVPRQRTVTGTVGNIAQVAVEADIKPPALIVIGQAVQLREKLNWFESRPLFGRRIVVTRSRSQSADLTSRLERLGAEVIEMPTIRITEPPDPQPLCRAIDELADFDWIVFTSANAVDAFMGAVGQAGRDSRALGENRICSIGPGTAASLAKFGLRPDVQPEKFLSLSRRRGRGADRPLRPDVQSKKFLSSEITPAIGAVESLDGKKVLCPRSDLAPPDLIEDLRAAGAVVHEVVAYHVEPDCSGAEKVAAMLADDELHWITFTSCSTVTSFFNSIRAQQVRESAVRLASIGPITSKALGEHGLSPDRQADRHTIDGLVDAIAEAEVVERTES